MLQFIALLLLLLLAKMGVLLLSLLFRTRVLGVQSNQSSSIDFQFSDELSMAGYLANLSIHRFVWSKKKVKNHPKLLALKVWP